MPEESLVSYLYRSTKRNHHDSIRACFPEVGLTYENTTTNVFSDRQLCVIKKAIGGKQVSLERMTSNAFADCSELLVRRSVKYCPLCIQERPYMKVQWGYRLTCVCLEHQAYLLNHCTRCGRRVTLTALMEGRCTGCRFQLARAKADSVHHYSVYQSQVDIHHWQAQEHPAVGRLDRTLYEQLLVMSFPLLTGLKSFVTDPDTVLRLDKRILTDVQALAELVANAHWMYSAFPVHFADVLNRFWTTKNMQTYPNKRAFEERLQGPHYQAIREAYDSYWLQAFNQGEISQRNSVFNSNSELLERRKVVNGQEVKAFCRIGKRRLKTWVSRQHIQAPRVRKQRLYVRQEVEHLKRALNLKKRYLTQKEAAARLGIYRGIVSKLVRDGLLTITTFETGERLVERRAVEALLRRCHAKARPGTGVPFYAAVSRHSSQGMSIERLIQLIQNGTLVVYANQHKGTLRDLEIDEESLNQSIAAMKANENRDYSLQEASVLLGISKEALKVLEAKGIFVPNRKTTQADGRVWYFYDRQAVDEWKDQLMTTREAAEELGLCEQTVTRLVRVGKLTDVYQGCTRSCFLRKRDVVDLKRRRSV